MDRDAWQAASAQVVENGTAWKPQPVYLSPELLEHLAEKSGPAPSLPPAFSPAPAPGPHEHRWVTEVVSERGGDGVLEFFVNAFPFHDHQRFPVVDAEAVFCAYPGCEARHE